VLGARHTPTHHHVTILATMSSRPNPETLATHEVLSHPRAVFHQFMCGLYGGAATVAAALIGYGGARSLLDKEVEEEICDRLLPLHRCASTLNRLLQLFFRYTTCLVVMIHDLLFTSFLR
jgi:hypothetical protein